MSAGTAPAAETRSALRPGQCDSSRPHLRPLASDLATHHRQSSSSFSTPWAADRSRAHCGWRARL
eukprot:7377340-Prymnesium_polylepis.1